MKTFIVQGKETLQTEFLVMKSYNFLIKNNLLKKKIIDFYFSSNIFIYPFYQV